MKAVKVDNACRVRLPELKPGEYYEVVELCVEGKPQTIVMRKLEPSKTDQKGSIAFWRNGTLCQMKLDVGDYHLTIPLSEKDLSQIGEQALIALAGKEKGSRIYFEGPDLEDPAGELGS